MGGSLRGCSCEGRHTWVSARGRGCWRCPPPRLRRAGSPPVASWSASPSCATAAAAPSRRPACRGWRSSAPWEPPWKLWSRPPASTGRRGALPSGVMHRAACNRRLPTGPGGTAEAVHAKGLVSLYLRVPDDARHGHRDAGQLLHGHVISEEEAAAHEDDHGLHMAHHLQPQRQMPSHQSPGREGPRATEECRSNAEPCCRYSLSTRVL